MAGQSQNEEEFLPDKVGVIAAAKTSPKLRVTELLNTETSSPSVKSGPVAVAEAEEEEEEEEEAAAAAAEGAEGFRDRGTAGPRKRSLS